MLKKTYALWLFGLALLSPLAQAAPTVQFDSATYVVDEYAGTVTITVTISKVPNKTVTVDYSTSDGTAMEGEDYASESGTLRWELMDGSDKTFTVDIYDDYDIEENETFDLTLTNVTGGAKLGRDEAKVTIYDDDGAPSSGTLQFTSSAYIVGEDEGSAKVTISRVNGSNNVVSVKCVSVNGSAKAGEDYTAVSKTLRWSHGETGDKICPVGINDDDEPEGDETFSLQLKDVTGGADIGDPSTAIVTIIDDDVEDKPGFFKFSKAEYSVEEGEGTVTLKVSRVYGDDGAVTVDYAAFDETAEAGEDYAGVSSTLYWKDGNDSEKTITIAIIDDTDFEDDETFIMALSNPTGGAQLGIPNTAKVTITDNDDKPAPGTLQFSEAKYSVIENGGTAILPVTRIKGSEGTVSVQCISSDGSAKAGEDYIEASGKLIWGDGDTSEKECMVTILDDTFYEGNETLKLTLKNATGGAKIGKPKKAVVTIIDDDDARGTLQFSSAEYVVKENGGSVKITVTRINGSEGEASVKAVTGKGTAKKNKDFKKTAVKLKWKDGDSSDKSFTVKIIDDNETESTETFEVKLKKAKGADLSNPKKAEVTIIDND
jgi:ribosomal protein L35AE/L33A